jgi:hypothetical protein
MPTLIGTSWFDIKKLKCPLNTLVAVDRLLDIREYNPNMWYIQVEPEAIIDSKDYLLSRGHLYGKVLTFNQEVLDSLKNAVKYVYGTTWITERNINVSKKEFKLSSITGKKDWVAGHKFRQHIYARQKEVQMPSVFYRNGMPDINGNPELGKSKFPLFETFQFSLVIENSRQTNYFTEKLCDCLITKTIPIYYGCPNISEYFDTTGWIILDSEDVGVLLEKLTVLTPEYYQKYTETIEKNYLSVQRYLDVYENLNRATS